jgi:hypothetical protein
MIHTPKSVEYNRVQGSLDQRSLIPRLLASSKWLWILHGKGHNAMLLHIRPQARMKNDSFVRSITGRNTPCNIYSQNLCDSVADMRSPFAYIMYCSDVLN